MSARKHFKKSIGRLQFKLCLFRFLKEIGYYRAYLKNMENYAYIGVIEEDKFTAKKVTVVNFLYKFKSPTVRTIFPYNDTLWDDIYKMWLEWAYEEDGINYLTKII